MKNIGESIKTKLKNISREKRISMDFMLMRYANERMIGRFAASDFADDFCLKGGMMLPIWNEGELFRPTSDIDLNGIGKVSSLNEFKEIVAELAAMPADLLGFEDGLDIDLSSLKSAYEKEGGKDGGKLEFNASIGGSRLKMRIDVGFGNPVTPETAYEEYPCLFSDDKKLKIPRPKIHTYTPETALAEKLHAVACFGKFNTRLKDYYDFYVIMGKMDFDQTVLAEAIARSFDNFGTEIPEELSGLSDEFAEENEAKWKAFNKHTNLRDQTPELREVVGKIREVFVPTTELARSYF